MSLGPVVISSSVSHIFVLTGLALFLVIFAILLILHGQSRRRLTLRLILSIISVMALTLIALQPRWAAKVTTTEAILMTPGVNLKSLPTFVDSMKTEFTVFSLERVAKKSVKNQSIKSIPDLAYLKRNYPDIKVLHVFGYGLPEYEWQEMEGVEVEFYPSDPPPGIQHITWPRKVQVGLQIQIQGSIVGKFKGDVYLYLTGPGGIVDSTLIGTGRSPFTLQAVARDSGKFLYTLSLKSSEKLWFQEKIPIEVISPDALNILILEQAPRFETRFLKKWLAEKQNSVAIRSAISRNRYRIEFLNFSQKSDLSNMSNQLLNRFDLLIIDGKSLTELSQFEYRALVSNIETRGLGVLIIPDNVVLNRDYRMGVSDDLFAEFKMNNFPELEYRQVKLNLPGLPDTITSTISAEPFELEDGWGIKPLIYDNVGRILVGGFRRGKGQIGLTLVRNSYKWILEGNAQFHASYWSYLISEFARPDFQNDAWEIAKDGPDFIHQPMQLFLSTQDNSPVGVVETVTGKKDSFYLKQHKIYPDQWQGTFWPGQIGWHRVSTVGGKPFWFYVHDNKSWQTWLQNQNLETSTRKAVMGSFIKGERNMKIITRAKAIPLIWFYLIFLISSALLWIERKI